MRQQLAGALILSLCLLRSTGLAAGQVNGNNIAAIQHTLATATDNPKVADTTAQTTKSSTAAAPAAAAVQQQAVPSAQNVAQGIPQAAQINNALTQATSLATQIIQAAPPASSLVKQVSATPNSISLAAPAGQQITLNPEGATFAAAPDQSSMTIGNAGVRYNDPQENVAPGQVPNSNFPGSGAQVVQNAPLNEAGTGPAPKSGSSFQPLGTSLGAVTTPQQNTEAALASMGQGGHQLSSSTSQGGEQRQQSRFQNNPYFRNYNDNSQRTTSYAANVPAKAGLLGGSAGANANPNAVTLTGPGGNSVSLGRKLLL